VPRRGGDSQRQRLRGVGAGLLALPGVVRLHPVHQADQALLVARCQHAIGQLLAVAAGQVTLQMRAVQIGQPQGRALRAAPGHQRLPHRPVHRLRTAAPQPASHALVGQPAVEGLFEGVPWAHHR
jgi:hypothetical protein